MDVTVDWQTHAAAAVGGTGSAVRVADVSTPTEPAGNHQWVEALLETQSFPGLTRRTDVCCLHIVTTAVIVVW